MPKKKKPSLLNSREQVDEILIEELDIELDHELTPATKIQPANDEDLLIYYILIRIEEALEIEIPDEVVLRIQRVQDVYNIVASLQAK